LAGGALVLGITAEMAGALFAVIEVTGGGTLGATAKPYLRVK